MSDEKYYRKPWMSDDQWECAKLFADLVHGFHHVIFEIKQHGDGIKCAMYSGQLATWDFDGLTRLVIMAHDRCIRADIISSGPRMIGIALHKRHRRDGPMAVRHPTIMEAVEKYAQPDAATSGEGKADRPSAAPVERSETMARGSSAK